MIRSKQYEYFTAIIEATRYLAHKYQSVLTLFRFCKYFEFNNKV